MPKAPVDPIIRSRRVRSVLLKVLALNLAVAAAKALAFFSSNALSIAAELTHTSLDAANNVFALWIARLAARAPDSDHPYGHHKFETLGALLLAGLLSVTVFELAQTAVGRILDDTPSNVVATPLAAWIMALSVAAGLGIATYEARMGKKLGSDILLADADHTRSDVITTLGVLAGLGLVSLGYPGVDPWISLVVAVVIARTGWGIIRRTIPVLVDERAVDPERIRRLAEAQEGVYACYGIRSRGRPGQIFGELTIAVDPELDVAASHAIADEVERLVTDHLDAREVVVHVEPAE